jgi:hypothetical protein
MMAFPRLLREDDSRLLHDRLRRLETSIVPGGFFDQPRHFRQRRWHATHPAC